ncbi:MAG: 5-(carboxyamino)imidazole ribonucleotide mutase [Candidatus Marinimicrobia bacterium]|nr:5-(carboxyamino)imidazole ribonucleotide mutase [Candidatus Neomarinimicrobiota bacterium]MBT3631335.1 5-(carboxyamino)imidazole ribonucleotide mutase [Candidatus Neomarinimicrobiota bacterium]MBT3825175.1 5-(carboxyamino)imidazole ribonucleotide mutase [Candidatus Neomarinimicrobiota bacterium]MBT4129375.1 5-(carboxyamino)imidazole ribonucleotide mutase [Candidatus Neomarinimicrobiota bacterium]MBT4296479.1 5-(carboxyamino)imidazole ribonucleotide mutase [Candidatus Neomarinimicrobiota bact
MAKIAIILGSDSDLPVLDKGFKIIEKLGLEFELRILSAHRTHEAVESYIKSFDEKGIELVIAGAGKAAHLPGVIAAQTVKPVIGLPIRASLDGVDALYSIVQMPGGIPVATVGINASDNAVLLAAQILALKYPEIGRKLEEHRIEMRDAVLEKDRNIQEKYNK